MPKPVSSPSPGDGTNPAVMEGAADALKANGGCGVPTVKPWNLETVRQKMDLVKAADPCAIAMDIDAAGLPFLKGMTPPAGSKTVDQLKDIAAMAGKPFILKGIMTVKGAERHWKPEPPALLFPTTAVVCWINAPPPPRFCPPS